MYTINYTLTAGRLVASDLISAIGRVTGGYGVDCKITRIAQGLLEINYQISISDSDKEKMERVQRALKDLLSKPQ